MSSQAPTRSRPALEPATAYLTGVRHGYDWDHIVVMFAVWGAAALVRRSARRRPGRSR